MNDLFKLILSLSLSASLVMVLIFIIGKIFKKRLAHAWHYYIWLVVIVRLLIPYAPETNLMNLIVRENQQSITTDTVIQPPQTENTPALLPQTETPMINADIAIDKTTSRTINIIEYLGIVWAGIAVAMFVWKVFCYMRFVRFAAGGRKRIENPNVLDLYQSAVRSLKLRRPPIIYKSRIAGVPMLIGLFRPYILIPDSQIDEQSLHHILLHELTHYKRHDGLYKWIVQIAVCIHWFNPLVHLVAREIDKACELSCDETVIRRLSASGRRRYGDMLLTSLQYSIQAPGRVMTLPLSKDGRLMKTRLKAIANYRRMSMSGIIIALLLTVCIMMGAVFAGAYPMQGQATSSGNTPVIAADRDNIESNNPPQPGEIPKLQASNSEQSTDYSNESTQTQTEGIPSSEKPFAKELEEMWPWIESLNKDIYSDYYRGTNSIVLQVTDVDAFKQSPAMTEAEENGWVFDLEEVRLSENEIDALITKMLNWDRRHELQISIYGASRDKSTMSVGTTSLSPQNRAIIEEFVGIGSLEFYNPEIANEVTGTGQYRMLGLDGIKDWYLPQLFDKPFVYNVLIKGPGLSIFDNGDNPDTNFYLQYDNAQTDEQMAELIEKKIVERYGEDFASNVESYTIEPVEVEYIG